MEVLLRRRSALENGITAVLLVGIPPPLPLATFCTNLPPNAPSDEPRAGGQPRLGLQIPDRAISVVPVTAHLEQVAPLSTAHRRNAPGVLRAARFPVS